MGGRKLPFSFANKMELDGKFVTLSIDVFAGSTPSTIAIDPDWWKLEDHPLVSTKTDATEVATVAPTNYSIVEKAAIEDPLNLPL